MESPEQEQKIEISNATELNVFWEQSSVEFRQKQNKSVIKKHHFQSAYKRNYKLLSVLSCTVLTSVILHKGI